MSDDKNAEEQPTSLHVIDHGDGTRTVRARYVVRVKFYHDGSPWLYLESQDAHIPPFDKGRGFMGFDLKDGTTTEQARDIAERLNDVITTTAYTGRLM